MPVLDGDTIRFTHPDLALPALRHPVLAKLVAPDDTLVAAIWRIDRTPLVRGELGYFLYEGVKHPTRAAYQYGQVGDVAVCVLKPQLRNRLGFSMSPEELVQQLFLTV